MSNFYKSNQKFNYNFSNYPIACNSSMLPEMDLKKYWIDDGTHIEMPVTMATIRKAIRLGMLEVEERRKREASNIQRCEFL